MQRRKWVQGAERGLLPWRLSDSKEQQPPDRRTRAGYRIENRRTQQYTVHSQVAEAGPAATQRAGGSDRWKALGIVVLLPRLVGCCQRLLLRLPELGQVCLERLCGGGGEW